MKINIIEPSMVVFRVGQKKENPKFERERERENTHLCRCLNLFIEVVQRMARDL